MVASSLTLACVLYTLVGSMGYLTFLERYVSACDAGDGRCEAIWEEPGG